MYKRILIPTDGSELSIHAIDQGMAFAKELGATVIGVTVTRPWQVVTTDPEALSETEETYNKRMKALTEQRLTALTVKARNAGVPCEVVARSDDHPYEAIVACAQAKQCDLILMASHGRSGFKSLMLGSETQKVLTHSKIPVLVHR